MVLDRQAQSHVRSYLSALVSWSGRRSAQVAASVMQTTTDVAAGELSSDDDFYMLDSGLVVLQTTNDILNASLYAVLDHRTVVSWQRVS